MDALLPLLEPLIGPKCAASLLGFNFDDVACLKLFLSKGLGLGIVAGGAILKVPQILKILSARSVKGVSFSSYFLETVAVAIGALSSAAVYALFDDAVVPAGLLSQLQWSTVFIGIGSKVPQIYEIYAAGTTGSLSAITVFLQFLGSAARVFTTLQEVNDTAILTGFLMATTLNGVVAAQMLYYWNVKAKSVSMAPKIKKKTPKAN
ncbi:hypothetical protein HK102_002347 [Quaeritorhiza haematococci]|nr:hypothetical protein HK102_002347 [Quaeritorhiza haematococci]